MSLHLCHRRTSFKGRVEYLKAQSKELVVVLLGTSTKPKVAEKFSKVWPAMTNAAAALHVSMCCQFSLFGQPLLNATNLVLHMTFGCTYCCGQQVLMAPPFCITGLPRFV